MGKLFLGALGALLTYSGAVIAAEGVKEKVEAAKAKTDSK